jgi:hypothetical protein|tara:strand:- start:2905 stop:3276 length:372 start_codon:yes stop_codon:yes gene_type:complete
MQNKGKLKMFVEHLLSEDQIPDSQRQTNGISSESPPQQVDVNDLLKRQSSDDTAPKLEQYPLNTFNEISSDLFINVQNLMSMLKSAFNNPSIKDKKSVAECYNIANSIDQTVVDLAKKVGKIK